MWEAPPSSAHKQAVAVAQSEQISAVVLCVQIGLGSGKSMADLRGE